MNHGDEEFWVASHERLPYDPYYDPILDGFGEPELMFEAIERDLEAEDTEADSGASSRDADNTWTEENAIGNDGYDPLSNSSNAHADLLLAQAERDNGYIGRNAKDVIANMQQIVSEAKVEKS